ncbi:MAG TPA: substrate-binding domain-containing protein [Burkholderiaceae bacterium]|nr:substrate-binding domain-containing protein [Burkholderiaceae bacterium]
MSEARQDKRLRRRQTSIRDVAELAGVSLGSASRVINGATNVTADVRQRVERAIEKLGYRPNHVARSLRSRSSKTVGFMFTDVTNPLYARVFRAVEERLGKEGYLLLLVNSLNIAEREVELLGLFQSRAVDGVIISPGNERDPQVLRAVRELPMPVVVFDRDLDAGRDSLLVDHHPAVEALVSELIGLGHRRIALLLAEAEVRPITRRLEGFRAAFPAHGLPVPEDLIVQLPSAMSRSFDAVRNLLRSTEPPTAIIALGTIMLNDAISAIADAGLRVPADVSLVSLGDPDFARSHIPGISTLRIDVDKVADGLVKLLLDRIRSGDVGDTRQILLDPELVRRESCAQATARPAASEKRQ